MKNSFITHLRVFKMFVTTSICACVCLLNYSNASAQGNLLISPKRLVFDNTQRSLEINLANTGKDTAKYLISTMEIRMKENGLFEEIFSPDSGQFFATRYLRFFPRTVVLAPNESQVVKVQLIKTSEMSQAEYRSHIYFRAIPKSNALGDIDSTKSESSISVKLIPVFGISIPVIIRRGNAEVFSNIVNPNLITNHTSKPQVKMTITRSGLISTYGDIHVEHIDSKNIVKEVGLAKGVAVYTPNTSRTFQFELSDTTINYNYGRLRIIYKQPDESSSKYSKYCDTTFTLH